MDNGIKMKGIVKNFGKKNALIDININVKEGEIFGLLGPSGAGKTTIIKILTGQLKSNKGEAEILGHNVNGLTEDVYAQIGMVLDNSGLYGRLSCKDNLELFCKLHNCNLKRIDEVLDRVGLIEARKRNANKLSKGMSQRLVLARAILHEPKLLFLDEPTSGLDPVTMNMIHELILDLMKEGTIIFMTTHNMEEATKLCNNVALLNDGKIVEYGNPEEICRKYNKDNEVTINTKDGKTVKIRNDEKGADEIARYFYEGMVKAIHSSEPNLANVFIKLTGRGLV